MVRTAAPAPAPQRAPRRQLPQEARHLRVVERGLTAAQRRRRARIIFVAGLGTATFVCFALVYLHVLLAQRQFRIDHLNREVQQEQAAYQQLRLQVAGLGSPAHIVSTAEGQLGMRRPSKVTYLTPSQSVPAQAGQPPSATSQLPGSQTGAVPGSGQGGDPGAWAAGDGSNSASSMGTAMPEKAPMGDADWPMIKSQLAGFP